MKLRSVTLRNVRRFTGAVRLDGLTDGLNLLSQPNEFGKSTIFDAIHALFFLPHGSAAKDAKALRPHSGGAPEVEIEVETTGGVATIAKRWFSKASATVHMGGRLIAQADEAEAWIADLLGDGGPTGLIWVRQGLTGLETGNKKDDSAAHLARADLMSSVGHEVEEMTGGKRMDAALARCRDELAVYATPTGRPLTSGPWKVAQTRVETLRDDRAALQLTADRLRQDLEARRKARTDLAEWEAPDAVRDRAERLRLATEAHRAAERHAQEVEAAAARVSHAQLELTRAAERLDRYRAAVTERSAAATAARDVLERTEAARARREAAETAFGAAAGAHEAARTARDTAEAARKRAETLERARAEASRRAALVDQLARAEAARTALETAEAEAKRGPDAQTVKRLEELDRRAEAARAARDAAAPQIVMRYVPGQEGRVRLGDVPLPADRPVPIPGAATLDIAGIGALDIRPATSAEDGDAARRAEAELRDALDHRGLADMASARTAAARRAEAEARAAEARTILRTLAPDGLETLRATLSAIPEGTDTGDMPDLPRATAAFEAADAALVSAHAAREAAAERRSEARVAAAALESSAVAARDRLAEATERLARMETNEEALADHVARAATALRAAEALHEACRKDAPDVETTRAALTRAEAVETGARQEIARLKPELAALDARISQSAGDAVEERLAANREELAEAEADLARIEHEVAVLRRLDAALDTARTEAREQYFKPVVAELRPLLGLLWPDAELTWGAETLLPESLIRNGQDEPLDILSGGTKEQIALLVRLAFARMLQRSGRHAPVILDDALVFTDDDRIEAMFHALHRQAEGLQILVLTCRQRAFRDLGANTLSLKDIKEE